MEIPGMFSWFHILCLILILGMTFFLSFFFKDTSEKTYKRILLFFWIVLLVFEVLKQLVKTFHYGNPSYWEYDPYDFPFHLCSMVLYFLPILIFVKRDGFLVDGAMGFMAFLILFAGLGVCIYTDMVMTRFIFINIQTMVHHGSQVILGVFVFVWNRKRITIHTYWRSLVLFAIVAIFAVSINLAFYPQGIDMFFLNPLQITTLPLVDVVQREAGFFVYLLGYLAVIAGLAFLMYFLETSIYKLVLKRKKE